MEIEFTQKAKKDYEYWIKTDKKILKKINELIKDIQKTPFKGKGKPEALKFSLSGYWSRRINHEHRLVYKIKNNSLVVIQCKYHY